MLLSSPYVLLLLPPPIFPLDGAEYQHNLTFIKRDFSLEYSVKILRRTQSGSYWGYLMGVRGLVLDASVGYEG